MKKEHAYKILSTLLLGVAAGTAFPLEPFPTIGSVAERLFVESSVVTGFAHLLCIIVGVILIGSAVALYKAHRFNPKFVPLERPIIYSLLGLILIAIPLLGKILGPTGSVKDLEKQQVINQGVQIQDIDAPLE